MTNLSGIEQRRPDPLFILAPEDVGASLLSAMLGRSPRFCDLPDINLFLVDTAGELVDAATHEPRLLDGLLRAVAELGLGEQSEENIESAAIWLEDYGSEATAELFRDLQDWAGERIVIDKSPGYVFDDLALPRIARALPGARYLHLIRHPLYSPQPADTSLEEDWLDPHLRILEFLEGVAPPLHIRLRFEDLLAEPSRYLIQIGQWLGVEFSPDHVGAMHRPGESPFAHPGPPSAPLGNAMEFLENPSLPTYHADRKNPEPALVPDETELLQHYARKFGYS